MHPLNKRRFVRPIGIHQRIHPKDHQEWDKTTLYQQMQAWQDHEQISKCLAWEHEWRRREEAGEGICETIKGVRVWKERPRHIYSQLPAWLQERVMNYFHAVGYECLDDQDYVDSFNSWTEKEQLEVLRRQK